MRHKCQVTLFSQVRLGADEQQQLDKFLDVKRCPHADRRVQRHAYIATLQLYATYIQAVK